MNNIPRITYGLFTVVVRNVYIDKSLATTVLSSVCYAAYT